MAAIDDRNTLGRARVSFADEADIDEFVTMLGRFERGEVGPDEWRAFRLVRGTYGQRQAEDAQMLRVKIPQGVLTPVQLNALADVADTHSRGFGHITTRQNMQFHFVKLHEIELAMRHLADAGLTTREACGSSVRNITACPYSGVAADEAFDVTPYAEAMTRYLLRHPLSSTLPRKFKIAFEGCPVDHVAAGINDIGWNARIGGTAARPVKGFQVTVAGGTSTVCRAGLLLFEFLPASEILAVAEAILRVFHRLGDYQHKQRNRLKFLIKTLGWDGFHREFERELEEVRAAGGPALPFDPEHPPVEVPPPVARLESSGSVFHRCARGDDAAARSWNPAQGRAASNRTGGRVRPMGKDQRAPAGPARLERGHGLDSVGRLDVHADAAPRRVGRCAGRRLRPGHHRSEPALPVGAE